MAELRSKLRGLDTRLQVTKNSLAERAADRAGVGEIKPLLVGPTALAMVRGDIAAAARTLSDTARVLRGPLEFKGGLMGGHTLSAEDLQAIAKLPAKEVLYGQLVGTIAAPLNGLARTLNALIGGLAIALGQVAEQGLVPAGGGAVAAPATENTEAASDDAADTDA